MAQPRVSCNVWANMSEPLLRLFGDRYETDKPLIWNIEQIINEIDDSYKPIEIVSFQAEARELSDGSSIRSFPSHPPQAEED